MNLRKIISGGQTGADRGALDAAIELGIEHGGWCPKGRRAEDGRIPERYRLISTAQTGYTVRTERNVLHSDATLIVSFNASKAGPETAGLRGGTAQTFRIAQRANRLLVVTGMGPVEADATHVRVLLRERPDIEVLNVAGPRESKQPGIQDYTRRLLVEALRGSR